MLNHKKSVFTLLYSLTILLMLSSYALPAPKVKFQKDRNNLLRKINMINKILAQTESKKKANTGQLLALQKKAAANGAFVKSLTKEVSYMNNQIHNQQQKINDLQIELAKLRKEYGQILYVGTKSMRDINILVFIFSADSFQNFLQRLRSTHQYIKIRKSHFSTIQRLGKQLSEQLKNLEKKVSRKHLLLSEKEHEQEKLYDLKQKQQKLLQDLEKERGQLLKELKKHNIAVINLDKLISDLVEQERKKEKYEASAPIMPALSAAAKALGKAFQQQRGNLPWPVKIGFISNKFGARPHPILKDIQIENLGIDIQTQEKSEIQAIFTGIVKIVSFVPGMNRIVIVQHGNYHSVYAKLETVSVKVGQTIEMGTPIGMVYTDPDGISILQFQIWENGQKVNPANWISKEPNK